MSSFILTDEPGVASVQRWTGPLLLSTGFNAWVHRCGAWPGMCLHHHLQLFLDDHVQNSEAPYGSHMFWYLPLSDLFFNVKNDCKTNCVVQFAANYSKNFDSANPQKFDEGFEVTVFCAFMWGNNICWVFQTVAMLPFARDTKHLFNSDSFGLMPWVFSLQNANFPKFLLTQKFISESWNGHFWIL